MKKLTALTLTLLLLCACVCAYGEALPLACPYAQTSPQGELCGLLAHLLGRELLCVEDEYDIACVDKMLAGEALCVHTQDALIRGLQGYTAVDPREGMTPVCAVARDDLYLLCTREAAQSGGFADLPGLCAYLTENEYALKLARAMSASAADYAAVTLLSALPLDQDFFLDETDMRASIQGGAYAFLADGAEAPRLALAGYVVLGALTDARTALYPDLPCAAEAGLPACAGTYYGVFAAAGEKADAQEIIAACQTPQWQAALSRAGLLPCEGGAEAFAARVAQDYIDYVDYMTMEGLFFYEEEE